MLQGLRHPYSAKGALLRVCYLDAYRGRLEVTLPQGRRLSPVGLEPGLGLGRQRGAQERAAELPHRCRDLIHRRFPHHHENGRAVPHHGRAKLFDESIADAPLSLPRSAAMADKPEGLGRPAVRHRAPAAHVWRPARAALSGRQTERVAADLGHSTDFQRHQWLREDSPHDS